MTHTGVSDRRTGADLVAEVLAAEGVRYVFGNPGTTELPLIEALTMHSAVEYIFALHEGAAVSMADAYAHASATVGVANLHVGPGLGNGLGSLYNAWEGGTPLIVTAGQQDTRMRLREPLLGHDLVAMAAPLCKWSVQAEHVRELPALLNRAFKTAREAPSGPVFVSLPMNVMAATSTARPLPLSRLFTALPPDPQGTEQAVELLCQAARPVVICGDKVAIGGAVQELVRLSETVGAPVYTEVLPAHVNFPTGHAHFQGRIPYDQALIRDRLADADAVVLVGGDFFEEVWFADTEPFPDGAKRIQIDPTPAALGRNYPVDCGLQGDIRRCLAAINEGLATAMDGPAQTAARQRCQALTATRQATGQKLAKRIAAAETAAGISTARLMAVLKETLPENTAIASEAITASQDLVSILSLEGHLDLLSSRGGGIGQGLPSALGLKLAYPERPVLCLTGDGSSLYSVQALWTAAHHRIPVVFLIINNRSYRILKLNLDRYRNATASNAQGYPHLDLVNPEMDYLALAAGFGVEATRVSNSTELATAIPAAFASNRPWLLDVKVDGNS